MYYHEKEKELREFILHELHSGATIYEAIGAYNMENAMKLLRLWIKASTSG